VDAVLESSFQRLDEKIRVTVRLLNVSDGAALWAYQCDEYCTDIFAAQDRISERVARALMPELTGEQRERLAKHYTDNFEAYQLYVLGRYFWGKRTEEGAKRGIACFEQAIYKDPNYALAYAGLAECYLVLAGTSFGNPQEFYPKVKAYATKALEIDETLAEPHTTLGSYIIDYEWDWPSAEKEHKRAIELNPGYATAHQRYSILLILMGRTEESFAEMRQALELDPISLIINSGLGLRFYNARRYDQAIEQLQKTLEMDPNFFHARFHLGQVYVQKGMYAEAIAELNKAVELSKDHALAALGYAYATAGQRGEARRVLAELQELSKRRYVSTVDVAVIHAGLGEKDQAFAWLEKAYQERAGKLVFVGIEPKFDSLRSDPRFHDLLRRMRLEP
jgi:tetratricopeptide (TPR) repeat protein